jgi:hypothetical protein
MKQDDLFRGSSNVIPLRGKGRDAMRTQRSEQRIENGFHPFGTRLREPAGETCRTCAFAMKHQPGANSYWKCSQHGVTYGPATDLRLKWPACVNWKAKP